MTPEEHRAARDARFEADREARLRRGRAEMLARTAASYEGARIDARIAARRNERTKGA